jgi:hypothetical protein
MAVFMGKSKAMKKIFQLAVLLILFSSCEKKDTGDEPSCVLEKIELYKTKDYAVAIKKIKVGGDTHYWFDAWPTETDFVTKAWILDQHCDTICSYCLGFCLDFPCTAIYQGKTWETIWEK